MHQQKQNSLSFSLSKARRRAHTKTSKHARTLRQEGAEALSCRAGEVDANGLWGQAVASVAARDLRAQQSAHRTVQVADPDT